MQENLVKHIIDKKSFGVLMQALRQIYYSEEI